MKQVWESITYMCIAYVLLLIANCQNIMIRQNFCIHIHTQKGKLIAIYQIDFRISEFTASGEQSNIFETNVWNIKYKHFQINVRAFFFLIFNYGPERYINLYDVYLLIFLKTYQNGSVGFDKLSPFISKLLIRHRRQRS